MTTGILITNEEGMRVIDLGITDEDNGAIIRTLVGGYIECLTIPLNPVVTMWVNEDGIRLGLPVNRLASDMVAGIQSYPLLGNVVMAGGATPDGHLLSCPQEWLDLAQESPDA